MTQNKLSLAQRQRSQVLLFRPSRRWRADCALYASFGSDSNSRGRIVEKGQGNLSARKQSTRMNLCGSPWLSLISSHHRKISSSERME
jgi:hypothetical protein